MRIKTYTSEVVVWAPAKVNLFLEVLGKRPDSYHEIQTFMVGIELFDTLQFREDISGQVRLTCQHHKLTTGPENLVCKAVRLVQEYTQCQRGVHVNLEKHIPMGAGLGGGSADAAATLVGLNRLWQLGLKQEEFISLGAQLGSDIPFFFHLPAAWCTGRGEQVAQAAWRRQVWLVLVSPRVALATPEVYRALTVPAMPQNGDALRQAAAEGRLEDLGRLLFNRLQGAAAKLCPAISAYLHRLAELHPLGQCMSGSGSSLFALCRNRREAIRLARALRHGPENKGFFVHVVGSCS